jgi:hypothetical protein
MNRWRLDWFSDRWRSTVKRTRTGTIWQIRMLQGALMSTMEDALTRPFGCRFEQ